MSHPSPALWTAVVLQVDEQTSRVCSDGVEVDVRYAPQFPTPHVERVSPGNLVALAAGSDGRAVVVWRWYDAVVVGGDAAQVRLWEPAHGEILATPRPSCPTLPPGSRGWTSAGLPGADWWLAGPVTDPSTVELDAVAALYADHGLWGSALEA